MQLRQACSPVSSCSARLVALTWLASLEGSRSLVDLDSMAGSSLALASSRPARLEVEEILMEVERRLVRVLNAVFGRVEESSSVVR